MTTIHSTPRHRPGGAARRRLLAGLPVAERRLELAGISTAVLEGGSGPPLVLLHGPGGNATHWAQVTSRLVDSCRVIVPDLPGQGASELPAGALDAGRVLAWLDELIASTCPTPPALVGQALGGAIAARFAAGRDGRIDRLVLVDALGLARFEPAPEFGRALHEFLAQPDAETHERLWRQCAQDLDLMRGRMGAWWGDFEAYNLDRIGEPGVRAALGALMAAFGFAAIPARELRRIRVPTALIWGRGDRASPLAIAERASARFGWPLFVIEDAGDDPPVERPDGFVAALRLALGAAIGEEAVR